MTTGNSDSRDDESVSQAIDDIIKSFGDWRSATLSGLRASIRKADPLAIEEVKWKKPSRPMGIPVWSHDGIICMGEPLKSAVRLTFPKGAQMEDPHKLFNTRLDSKTVRAIDVHEGETVDESGLKALVQEAVELNTSKAGQK